MLQFRKNPLLKKHFKSLLQSLGLVMYDGQNPVGMKIQLSQLFFVQMHKPMLVCNTDPKKLVHIGRKNGHELKPFPQRHLAVLGLKQDPFVEFQP